jgi:hypothetical protein
MRMTDLDEIILDNYEDEDIFDVVIKLEKSFGIKFDKTAFLNVKTFGDLCDIFEVHIQYESRDDCTKQQAFYKIRKAISAAQLIDWQQIKLDSNLTELFPKDNRRSKIKEFQSHLGFRLNLLTYPDWLDFLFGIGFLLSLIAFFFDWKIAISGITLFILSTKLANKLGKDMEQQTVRQLTEKIVRENYIDSRRLKETVNQKEILTIITDSFSNDLGIDKAYLTRDAKFSWA